MSSKRKGNKNKKKQKTVKQEKQEVQKVIQENIENENNNDIQKQEEKQEQQQQQVILETQDEQNQENQEKIQKDEKNQENNQNLQNENQSETNDKQNQQIEQLNEQNQQIEEQNKEQKIENKQAQNNEQQIDEQQQQLYEEQEQEKVQKDQDQQIKKQEQQQEENQDTEQKQEDQHQVQETKISYQNSNQQQKEEDIQESNDENKQQHVDFPKVQQEENQQKQNKQSVMESTELIINKEKTQNSNKQDEKIEQINQQNNQLDNTETNINEKQSQQQQQQQQNIFESQEVVLTNKKTKQNINNKQNLNIEEEKLQQKEEIQQTNNSLSDASNQIQNNIDTQNSINQAEKGSTPDLVSPVKSQGQNMNSNGNVPNIKRFQNSQQAMTVQNNNPSNKGMTRKISEDNNVFKQKFRDFDRGGNNYMSNNDEIIDPMNHLKSPKSGKKNNTFGKQVILSKTSSQQPIPTFQLQPSIQQGQQYMQINSNIINTQNNTKNINIPNTIQNNIVNNVPNSDQQIGSQRKISNYKQEIDENQQKEAVSSFIKTTIESIDSKIVSKRNSGDHNDDFQYAQQNQQINQNFSSKKDRLQTFNNLFVQGNKQFQNQQYNECIKTLVNASSVIHPDNFKEDMGQFHECLQNLNKTFLLISKSHLELREYETCLNLCDHILSTDPENYEVMKMKSICQQNLGIKNQDFEKQLQKAESKHILHVTSNLSSMVFEQIDSPKRQEEKQDFQQQSSYNLQMLGQLQKLMFRKSKVNIFANFISSGFVALLTGFFMRKYLLKGPGQKRYAVLFALIFGVLLFISSHKIISQSNNKQKYKKQIKQQQQQKSLQQQDNNETEEDQFEIE